MSRERVEFEGGTTGTQALFDEQQRIVKNPQFSVSVHSQHQHAGMKKRSFVIVMLQIAFTSEVMRKEIMHSVARCTDYQYQESLCNVLNGAGEREEARLGRVNKFVGRVTDGTTERE